VKKWITYLFVFCGIKNYSQNGNVVFNDTILHEIYIQTDLPDWFATLEEDFKNSLADPVKYPEVYQKCKVTFDGVLIDNCGFREKGNASNFLASVGKKKPIKLSFNEFVDGQELDDLRKLNLNNFVNDPSCLHDCISFKLMRDNGLYAPRTAFAKVYINNEYIGLYVLIENVDKAFLKFQFGKDNNDGNLYKTDRGAKVFLDYKGSDYQPYKNDGLKLTTNDSLNDYSGVINFIEFLNNYKEPDFKDQFEKRFDVHAYLKVLAIEKCVKSWDSYWGGGNNFFLYDHPDGKFRWISWDMNESFQEIKTVGLTSALDGYLLPTPQMDKRPLLKRIFEYPEYKQEFFDNACNMVQNYFTNAHLGQFILDRHKLIDRAYELDRYKANAYDAFQSSLTDQNQDDVSLTKNGFVLRINYPGIFPFMQTQREWVQEQLKDWGRECSIGSKGMYELTIFPNPAGEYVNVSNANAGFEYAQFRMFDFTGAECFRSKFEVMTGDFYKLPIGDVPPGIYILLKYSEDGKIGRAKLVVE
jgi:spore coat protein CotH